MCARSKPASSMTATRSSTRWSMVGMRSVRSDAPVPRLSKWSTLAKRPSRAKNAWYSGRSHASSMFWASGGTATIRVGPRPHVW